MPDVVTSDPVGDVDDGCVRTDALDDAAADAGELAVAAVVG